MTLPVGRLCLLALVDGLVVLILAVVVVDDPQDLDEAEGSSQPAQAAGLEGDQLGFPRERLEGCQHVSRQLAIGAGAAVVTYALGRLFGVTVG